MPIRILAIGDIVGRPGRQAVHDLLPGLVKKHQLDLVIANGENIAGGSGITTNLFNKLRAYGVDVVTLGDHVFKKQDIVETLNRSERIVRPANISRVAAGRGHTVVTTSSGVPVSVAMVIGRVYVPTMPASDPFEAIDRILETEKSRAKVFVVEVHAEATGEKVALGHYLDGKASLVFGTHTHIPTADARLLPGGTAYISDVGMTGPYDSVLGRRKEAVVKSMVTSMHVPYDVATGDVRLCGVMVEVDETTGRAISVERVEVPYVHAGPAYDADDQGR
jgi:metallophosphoesterase (TIGR00282 family)